MPKVTKQTIDQISQNPDILNAEFLQQYSASKILLYAVTNCRVDVVNKLLSIVSARPEDMLTLISSDSIFKTALERHNLEVVRIFLNALKTPQNRREVISADNYSAVRVAARFSAAIYPTGLYHPEPEVINELLKALEDSESKIAAANNSFAEAVRGDVASEIVPFLLSILKTPENKKEAISSPHPVYGGNAIISAARHGKEKLVNILLNALETPENKLEIIRQHSFSPIRDALKYGHLEIAGLLFSSVAQENREPLVPILKGAPKNIREYIAVTNEDVALNADPFLGLNEHRIVKLRELKTSLENKGVQSDDSNRVIGFLLRDGNLKQFSDEVKNIVLIGGMKKTPNAIDQSEVKKDEAHQAQPITNEETESFKSLINNFNAPKFFTDLLGKEKSDTALNTIFNFLAAPLLAKITELENNRPKNPSPVGAENINKIGVYNSSPIYKI